MSRYNNINTHTYPICITYYRCQKCGKIIEDRKEYQKRLHGLEKEINCSRCFNKFFVIKTHNDKEVL